MEGGGEEEKREVVVGGRRTSLTFIDLSEFEFTKSSVKSIVGS